MKNTSENSENIMKLHTLKALAHDEMKTMMREKKLERSLKWEESYGKFRFVC